LLVILIHIQGHRSVKRKTTPIGLGVKVNVDPMRQWIYPLGKKIAILRGG
jgi:hypothetical protein